MAVGKITKRAVESIALPAGTARSYLWDETLKGFGVMVTPAGSRSYLVQYQMGGRGTPTRRYTIGRHGSPYTADKARERATDVLELVRKGVDPVDDANQRRELADDGKRTAERLAFDSYVTLFLTKYVEGNGLRRSGEIKSIFNRDLVTFFKSRPLPSIRRSEITDCLDAVGERSVSAAIKAHTWLRKLFVWAVDRGDIPSSPMAGMSPPGKDGKRSRVLVGDELRAVWAGSDLLAEPFASFVKVLLLTGQRLREVAGMRWEEIDLAKAEWVIPGVRTKNKRDHLVPLCGLSVGILSFRFPIAADRTGLIFTTTGKTPISGFSKLKIALDKRVLQAFAALHDGQLPMFQPWVLHDLRRSFSTGCQSLGFPIEHTEAAINHISGKRGGLVGVYQFWEYQPEKVAVMAAWSRHVEALLSKRSDNVIPLAAARA